MHVWYEPLVPLIPICLSHSGMEGEDSEHIYTDFIGDRSRGMIKMNYSSISHIHFVHTFACFRIDSDMV